ncbi:hypothetical protein [Algoriphagus machipongonensis]|uniref:Uncharacterized protein n=1 Tax=Algoriphagus machipongonensis TaxID=388413 RepID=A3HW11_9BACT|nr:hypothetical protein [Algoriphagus machipongonensis]EAZ82333.1 hypothetical protein ALPR1_03790 [Algoriphagus machipongonensis]
MAKKKKKKAIDPKVHDDLKGFKMDINSFGEISSSFPIDKINEFLNKNVEDKKLKDRDDLDLDDNEEK